MKTWLAFGVLMLPTLFLDTAYAYGSGSSSKACEKPSFSKFQPAPNESVPAFNEFSFTASPNTSTPSIAVVISSGEFKHIFKANDLHITELKNGALEVKGKLQNPLKEGFARLNIDAKSKRGCAVAEGYLIKLGTGK